MSAGRHPRDFKSGPFTAKRWPSGNGWDIATKSFLLSTPPPKTDEIAVRTEEIKHLRRLLTKLEEYEHKLPPRAK